MKGDISTTIYSRQESQEELQYSRNIPILVFKPQNTTFPMLDSAAASRTLCFFSSKRNVKHHFKWKREMKFITMSNLFLLLTSIPKRSVTIVTAWNLLQGISKWTKMHINDCLLSFKRQFSGCKRHHESVNLFTFCATLWLFPNKNQP